MSIVAWQIYLNYQGCIVYQCLRSRTALRVFAEKSQLQTEYVFALALLHYGLRSLLSIAFSPKEICWFSRKSVILRRQLNKNIKLTMLQRRINNWTTISNRGIKCLESMSYVQTSGIGAFYTFGDIFRRTFDRPSGIR